jgi:hypothetical protein
MAVRIANQAAPGTLLDKRRRSNRVRSDAPGQRKPRERDDQFLALIRQLSCIRCGQVPSEAAHIRLTVPGKKITGKGMKPDDRFSCPLCSECHTIAPDSQHRSGEKKFWARLKIDPLQVAAELYAAAPDLAAMQMIIFRYRRV